jgi:surface antigen
MKRLATTVIAIGVALTGIPLHPEAGSAVASGQNPYPVGKSTYWAWQNRPDLPAGLGEAHAWDDAARARGWPVTAYPRPGAVAVHEPGVLGADRTAGRVAYVRQVLDNGNYIVTVMDDGDCANGSARCGTVYTREYRQVAGSSFIHHRKDSRTTWGFAGGASGWTALNTGAGAPDGTGWRYPLAGGDAHLLSPELDIPLQGYNTVEVQMSLDPSIGDTTLQLYFSTASHPGFSVERRGRVSVKADGAMRAYRVHFGAHHAWKGQLTRLRLHPARAGAEGSVHIERIRLLNLDTSTSNGAEANPARAGRE